jgi:hypothetical protein
MEKTVKYPVVRVKTTKHAITSTEAAQMDAQMDGLEKSVTTVS